MLEKLKELDLRSLNKMLKKKRVDLLYAMFLDLRNLDSYKSVLAGHKLLPAFEKAKANLTAFSREFGFPEHALYDMIERKAFYTLLAMEIDNKNYIISGNAVEEIPIYIEMQSIYLFCYYMYLRSVENMQKQAGKDKGEWMRTKRDLIWNCFFHNSIENNPYIEPLQEIKYTSKNKGVYEYWMLTGKGIDMFIANLPQLKEYIQKIAPLECSLILKKPEPQKKQDLEPKPAEPQNGIKQTEKKPPKKNIEKLDEKELEKELEMPVKKLEDTLAEESYGQPEKQKIEKESKKQQPSALMRKQKEEILKSLLEEARLFGYATASVDKTDVEFFTDNISNTEFDIVASVEAGNADLYVFRSFDNVVEELKRKLADADITVLHSEIIKNTVFHLKAFDKKLMIADAYLHKSSFVQLHLRLIELLDGKDYRISADNEDLIEQLYSSLTGKAKQSALKEQFIDGIAITLTTNDDKRRQATKAFGNDTVIISKQEDGFIISIGGGAKTKYSTLDEVYERIDKYLETRNGIKIVFPALMDLEAHKISSIISKSKYYIPFEFIDSQNYLIICINAREIVKMLGKPIVDAAAVSVQKIAHEKTKIDINIGEYQNIVEKIDHCEINELLHSVSKGIKEKLVNSEKGEFELVSYFEEEKHSKVRQESATPATDEQNNESKEKKAEKGEKRQKTYDISSVLKSAIDNEVVKSGMQVQPDNNAGGAEESPATAHTELMELKNEHTELISTVHTGTEQGKKAESPVNFTDKKEGYKYTEIDFADFEINGEPETKKQAEPEPKDTGTKKEDVDKAAKEKDKKNHGAFWLNDSELEFEDEKKSKDKETTESAKDSELKPKAVHIAEPLPVGFEFATEAQISQGNDEKNKQETKPEPEENVVFEPPANSSSKKRASFLDSGIEPELPGLKNKQERQKEQARKAAEKPKSQISIPDEYEEIVTQTTANEKAKTLTQQKRTEKPAAEQNSSIYGRAGYPEKSQPEIADDTDVNSLIDSLIADLSSSRKQDAFGYSKFDAEKKATERVAEEKQEQSQKNAEPVNSESILKTTLMAVDRELEKLDKIERIDESKQKKEERDKQEKTNEGGLAGQQTIPVAEKTSTAAKNDHHYIAIDELIEEIEKGFGPTKKDAAKQTEVPSDKPTPEKPVEPVHKNDDKEQNAFAVQQQVPNKPEPEFSNSNKTEKRAGYSGFTLIKGEGTIRTRNDLESRFHNSTSEYELEVERKGQLGYSSTIRIADFILNDMFSRTEMEGVFETEDGENHYCWNLGKQAAHVEQFDNDIEPMTLWITIPNTRYVEVYSISMQLEESLRIFTSALMLGHEILGASDEELEQVIRNNGLNIGSRELKTSVSKCLASTFRMIFRQ